MEGASWLCPDLKEAATDGPAAGGGQRRDSAIVWLCDKMLPLPKHQTTPTPVGGCPAGGSQLTIIGWLTTSFCHWPPAPGSRPVLPVHDAGHQPGKEVDRVLGRGQWEVDWEWAGGKSERAGWERGKGGGWQEAGVG